MKVTLRKTTVTLQEVEITLPIYREHNLFDDDCDHVILTRINEDLSATHLERCERYIDDKVTYRIEQEKKYNFDNSDSDFHLGQGSYKCTAKQFDELLKEITDYLHDIRVTLSLKNGTYLPNVMTKPKGFLPGQTSFSAILTDSDQPKGQKVKDVLKQWSTEVFNCGDHTERSKE